MLSLKPLVIILLLSFSVAKAGQEVNSYTQAEIATEQTSIIIRFKEKVDQERRIKRSRLKGGLSSNPENALRHYESFLSQRNLFDSDDPRLERLKKRISRQGRLPVIKHFSNANIKALSVDNDDLLILESDPTIDVFRNQWHKPMLTSSVPIVFPDQSTSDYDGSDQVVVLLDTGVASNHSFLSNKVVAEGACFSNEGNPTAGGMPITESLCVGGAGSSVGGSSGSNCDGTITGCWHGTNMAGIIAGADMSSNGVATGAKVFSIQVGTKINDETICGDEMFTPCVAASTVDLISALEYSNDVVRLQHPVASVNISLGTTDALQGQCDGAPIAQSINDLRDSGVAVIAASGNAPLGFAGNSIAMSSPACVSSAIAVAATNDADVPLIENNRSSELDFFAPGFDIMTSTLPISTFAITGGTSAAAAHVAAAFAVLKDKNETLNVGDLESILKTSGDPIVQGPLTRSRIDITQALAATPAFVPDEELCIPVKAINGNIAVICL